MEAATVEAILTAVAQIITIAAPIVVKGVENAAPFAQMIYGLVTGTNLTNDDIDAVLAKANALSAQIQDPNFIAPKQDDDV
jgi:hypothetical protein